MHGPDFAKEMLRINPHQISAIVYLPRKVSLERTFENFLKLYLPVARSTKCLS
jgi:hypothetical protein